MKNKVFYLTLILFVFIISLTFFGCAPEIESPNEPSSPQSEPKYFNVSFFTNSYYTIDGIRVKKGTKINLPTPIKSGYKFLGWFSDENFENAYNFDNEITDNLNLYAKWSSLYEGIYSGEKTYSTYSSPSAINLKNDGTFEFSYEEKYNPLNDDFTTIQYIGTYENDNNNLILCASKVTETTDNVSSSYEEEYIFTFKINEYSIVCEDITLYKEQTAMEDIIGFYVKNISDTEFNVIELKEKEYKSTAVYYDKASKTVIKSIYTNEYRRDGNTVYLTEDLNSETKFEIINGYLFNSDKGKFLKVNNAVSSDYLCGLLINFDGKIIDDEIDLSDSTIIAIDFEFNEIIIPVTKSMLYFGNSITECGFECIIQWSNIVFKKPISKITNLSTGDNKSITITKNSVLSDSLSKIVESKYGAVFKIEIELGKNYQLKLNNDFISSVAIVDEEETIKTKTDYSSSPQNFTFNNLYGKTLYIVITFNLGNSFIKNLNLFFDTAQ